MQATLYSFRRCPYAIRARLAIHIARLDVAIIEVSLRDKPLAMLKASPKGTVPVLLTQDGKIIDESLDIMVWALTQHDPLAWLQDSNSQHPLLHENDHHFKYWLDRYKYAVRFPEQSIQFYRQQAESFIQKLESRLQKHAYLICQQPSLTDMGIVPFVRQFAHVDKDWFTAAPYPHLQQWLKHILQSDLFQQVMQKKLRRNMPEQAPPIYPKVC